MSQRDAHEHFAIAARRLHWIAGGLAVTLALIMFAMYLLMRGWLHSSEPSITHWPPGPRLQPEPAADLARQRAHDAAQSQSYRWENREAGIAQIPVERAMQLLAAPASASSGAGAR